MSPNDILLYSQINGLFNHHQRSLLFSSQEEIQRPTARQYKEKVPEIHSSKWDVSIISLLQNSLDGLWTAVVQSPPLSHCYCSNNLREGHCKSYKIQKFPVIQELIYMTVCICVGLCVFLNHVSLVYFLNYQVSIQRNMLCNLTRKIGFTSLKRGRKFS